MSIFDFCGKKLVFVAPAMALMLGLGATISSATDSFESEMALFTQLEGNDDAVIEKKRMHFIRISRHLIAKLREQKTAFSKAMGSDKNMVSMEVEELINMANLSASQESYEEGVKNLVKAYSVVTVSINEISAK